MEKPPNPNGQTVFTGFRGEKLTHMFVTFWLVVKVYDEINQSVYCNCKQGFKCGTFLRAWRKFYPPQD